MDAAINRLIAIAKQIEQEGAARVQIAPDLRAELVAALSEISATDPRRISGAATMATTPFGPPGSEPARVIPSDTFSNVLRGLNDNPGAIGAGSTVHCRDFYGNLETWVVETWRADGHEFIALQRNDAVGGMRLIIPPEVCSRLASQRDQVIAKARRRSARATVEMRRLRGDRLGNPAALAKARKARAKKGGR